MAFLLACSISLQIATAFWREFESAKEFCEDCPTQWLQKTTTQGERTHDGTPRRNNESESFMMEKPERLGVLLSDVEEVGLCEMEGEGERVEDKDVVGLCDSNTNGVFETEAVGEFVAD